MQHGKRRNVSNPREKKKTTKIEPKKDSGARGQNTQKVTVTEETGQDQESGRGNPFKEGERSKIRLVKRVRTAVSEGKRT